jgi:hypothetical protein
LATSLRRCPARLLVMVLVVEMEEVVGVVLVEVVMEEPRVQTA